MRTGLLIWLFFSPIAALMAYLITYEEYRHHFPKGGRAMREAAGTALFTLAVFLLLGGLVTALMPWIAR